MSKILDKLLCSHKWQAHAKVENSTILGYKVDGVAQTTEILICEKCGKIKKLIY